ERSSVSKPVFSMVRLKRRRAASNGSFSFSRTIGIKWQACFGVNKMVDHTGRFDCKPGMAYWVIFVLNGENGNRQTENPSTSHACAPRKPLPAFARSQGFTGNPRF